MMLHRARASRAACQPLLKTAQALPPLPSLPRRTLQTLVHSSPEDGGSGGFFTPSSPSSSSSPGRRPSSEDPDRRSGRERVSDHEYHVRIGRASDLLRATLPDFMRTGLVDYQNAGPSRSSGLTLLDVFTFRALQARPVEAEKFGSSSTTLSSESAAAVAAAEQVYDPRIHFVFRPAPPTTTSAASTSSSSAPAAPTDDEAASLSFSGRSLYFASAHVLRHTLSAIFSDASVEVAKVRLESKADRPRVDDVLHVRLNFTGHMRVTGQEHHLTLIFRYDFDPESGRIIRHTVERVEPAIGRKLWTGIATVWQRLLGHQPTPIPSACHMNTHQKPRSSGVGR